MRLDTQAISEAAQAMGYRLEANQLHQLEQLYALLEEGNAKTNLTAVRNEERFVELHVLDNLALATALDTDKPLPRRFIDVGAGAGFPTLPWAIALPAYGPYANSSAAKTAELSFVALESNGKKTAFIEAAVRALQLSSAVEVVCERAERVAHGPMREDFDVAVARAVASVATTLEFTLPLVRTGGLVLLPKGPTPQAEVAAARQACKLLGGVVEQVIERPGDRPTLSLVVVRKVAPTPKHLPRRPGVPKKSPL